MMTRRCAWLAAILAMIGTTAVMADERELIGNSIRQVDRAVTRIDQQAVVGLLQSLRPNDDGLIGRNRDAGAFDSARMQMGAGDRVRMSIALGGDVDRELSALLLPFITPEGRSFRQNAPGGIAVDNDALKASGDAFFLADACPALAAANSVSVEPTHLRELMGRLLAFEEALLSADRRAPNRLLYTALAFRACGSLIGDETIIARAIRFEDAAFALQRDDGVFLEDGGTDTSYHGVSMRVLSELTPYAEATTEGAHNYRASLARASAWLEAKIPDNGELNSSANNRTCGGGETFFGRKKGVDVRNVWFGLARAAVLLERTSANNAANRLTTRIRLGGIPEGFCFAKS
ncbi:MAG: hypothetical protein AAFR13_02840 [Pseudomonadota bacterium]